MQILTLLHQISPNQIKSVKQD